MLQYLGWHPSQRYISKNLRLAPKKNHHLATPPHLNQGFDIDPFHYNDSICPRAHFFYLSHLGFCHPWLLDVIQVGWNDDDWFQRHQNGRYEITHLLFHRKWRWTRIYVFFPILGVIFGGIHCAGWFFYFPSSDEAMLWRVSSAVITGIPFLYALVIYLLKILNDLITWDLNFLFLPLSIIALLVYVVSRLLLLVEAFISLRHLTPGMLAVVKWTSFIPHI